MGLRPSRSVTRGTAWTENADLADFFLRFLRLLLRDRGLAIRELSGLVSEEFCFSSKPLCSPLLMPGSRLRCDNGPTLCGALSFAPKAPEPSECSVIGFFSAPLLPAACPCASVETARAVATGSTTALLDFDSTAAPFLSLGNVARSRMSLAPPLSSISPFLAPPRLTPLVRSLAGPAPLVRSLAGPAPPWLESPSRGGGRDDLPSIWPPVLASSFARLYFTQASLMIETAYQRCINCDLSLENSSCTRLVCLPEIFFASSSVNSLNITDAIDSSVSW